MHRVDGGKAKKMGRRGFGGFHGWIRAHRTAPTSTGSEPMVTFARWSSADNTKLPALGRKVEGGTGD